MERRAAIAVAVALLALAGCQGPASEPTHTTTVTPAPVPSASAPPPGVGTVPAGVDAATLVDAHAVALSNRSYRVETTVRAVPLADGPAVSWLNRTSVIVAGGFYRSTRLTGPVFAPYGDPSRRVHLSNGSFAVARQYRDGLLADETLVDPRDPDVDSQFSSYLPTLLRAVDVERVDRIDRDGTVRYRVLAGASGPLPDGSLAAHFHDVRDVRASMTVSPAGAIQRLQVSYLARNLGHRYRVRRTVAVSRVGSATLPRPAWLSRVGNATEAGSDGSWPHH